MTWVKVDDNAPDDPRVLKLPRIARLFSRHGKTTADVAPAVVSGEVTSNDPLAA